MHAIDRRAVASGLALPPLCGPARAGIPERINVDVDEGSVALTRYAADRDRNRTSVLLLHGSHGFYSKPSAYQRYGRALAAKGIDAWYLPYFTAADEPAFDRQKTAKQEREA